MEVVGDDAVGGAVDQVGECAAEDCSKSDPAGDPPASGATCTA